MKREIVLKSVYDFLVKENLVDGLCEVHIPEQARNDGDIRTPRSIFFTGIDSIDELEEFLVRNELEYSITSYDDLKSLKESSFIDRSSVDLSNNWRGRIIRYGNDFDYTISKDEFNSKFLVSYWRLIVTRADGNFFTKHNLQPVYYYPGDSNAGHSTYDGGVKNFVNYLIKATESPHPRNRVLDPFYDYVILFAVEKDGNPYNIIYPFDNLPTLLDDRKILLKTFLQKCEEDRDGFIDNICSGYRLNWLGNE